MSKIMTALATLARESWMDEMPDEHERDHWRQLSVDGRIEYDALRQEIANARLLLVTVSASAMPGIWNERRSKWLADTVKLNGAHEQ